MKIYIAGPMTGIPQFNFPAFMDAERTYAGYGWTVFNPANKDLEAHGEGIMNATGSQEQAAVEVGFNLRDALAWDTARICESDAVYMLRGWENSKGAFAEWALAKALGLDIFYQGGTA